jgi:RimJ/RimL family protein N-acetyltransferase
VLYKEKRYCYFATEIKSTKEFIGFVGLQDVDLNLDFTPATDIGWRLKRATWQREYTTEAAAETIRFGFNQVKLK